MNSLLLRKLKKSFSLVQLGLYILAIGILTILVLNGAKIVENTEAQRVINDILYYQQSMQKFLISYGNLPGELSKDRCEIFSEFTGYCNQTKGSMETTTTIPNKTGGRYLSFSNDYKGQPQTFNYGRFLKQAGLIDSVLSDLTMELKATNNDWFLDFKNEPKTYFPSVHDRSGDVFFFPIVKSSRLPGDLFYDTTSGTQDHIYLYNYSLKQHVSECELCEDTDMSSNPFLHIMFASIYKRTEMPAFSPRLLKNIDIKIDDGMPRTGILIGVPAISNQCDDSSEYKKDDIAYNNGINYLDSKKQDKGCQMIFQTDINVNEYITDNVIDDDVNTTP